MRSVGFTKQQLATYRDVTVPDLIGDGCRLLFVGINPGLWTAATGTHFCHPSNRFYPALRIAGVIDWDVDTNIGLIEEQRREITELGIGVTNLVTRATVRASELSNEELVAGAERLASAVEGLAPGVVAVAGISAYRSAFRRPKAMPGPQREKIAGSELWVVPNPSGLNAHETVHSLAEKYRVVAERAGIL